MLKKPIGRKTLTPSPGISGNDHLTKSEYLRRFADPEDTEEEIDIFGEAEDDLNDEFQTLKLNPQDLETLRGDIMNNRQNDVLPKFRNIPDLDFSPMDSISTSSPKLSLMVGNGKNNYQAQRYSKHVTRSALSDYSEGDDTDQTSQMNDEEFEDLDDVFGVEEAAYDNLHRKLQSKQLQLQYDVEREEAELKSRMQMNRQMNQTNIDANATLKLKDFNLINTLSQKNLNSHNQLDEKTIDYEYVRDEFEDFEEGFDTNFESRFSSIKQPKLTRFHSSSRLNSSNDKKHQERINSIKRYKSTMDFAGQNSRDATTEPPKYNFDNRVKSRLERIPSFYNKTNDNKAKQNYLNKLQESAATKSRQSQPPTVGLLRYLNNNTIVTIPVIPTNMKMTYNATLLNWEGNEIDLLRFESLQKPSLITLNDINVKKDTSKVYKSPEKNSNMKFDSENLRWINSNEENESIFNDIPDLDDNNKHTNTYKKEGLRKDKAYHLSSPPKIKHVLQELELPMTKRGLSQFTQRTISTNDLIEEEKVEIDDFFISDKLIDRFKKEEAKITRKISHWFDVHEEYNFENPNTNVDLDYYWEIRKLVMDTERD